MPWQRSFTEENTRFPFPLLSPSPVNPGKRGGSRVSALFYERVKSREKNVAKCTFRTVVKKKKKKNSRAESNGFSGMKMQFLYLPEGGRARRNARRAPDNDVAQFHENAYRTQRGYRACNAIVCAVKSAIGAIVSPGEAGLRSKWGENVEVVRWARRRWTF